MRYGSDPELRRMSGAQHLRDVRYCEHGGWDVVTEQPVQAANTDSTEDEHTERSHDSTR